MLENLHHLMLARAQFGLNITFHILFPSITIALGWFILFFKCCAQATGEKKWMDAYFFWTKIFALCFALGVVSGVTMSFQFGTNWPGFMQKVGNVAGPLLAYEVLTAFFMEATFLGVMLFGYRRVKPWVHTAATCLVASGTTLSAFWILALNSWMQTPTGYIIREGVIYPARWLDIIFNPTFPYHLAHMLLASVLTGSFLLAGLSAYRWLRTDKDPSVMSTLKIGVVVAAVCIPFQIVVGDLHGLSTLHHQPQKIAAIEAIWHTQKGVPLTLLGMPNEKKHQTRFSLEVPHGASLILTHAWNGEIKGLDEFKNNHPPVMPLFWGFRIMVGMGMLMLFVSWLTCFYLWRQKLPRWLAHVLVGMSFSGWIATVSGWYITEIGRQPWLVYGLLKTEEAAAPTVTSSMIGMSLAMYGAIYSFLILAFIRTLFYMARKAQESKDYESSHI